MEKLLIITNEFKKAGVGRYIQKLIPQLKKNFQITIVSRDKLTKSEKSKYGISNSIQIRIPKYIDIWPIKELLFFLKGITFFKKNKFDVIFCNYSFFIPNKIKKNTRVIHVFHSLHKQFLFANTPKKFKFLIIKLIHLFLIPLDNLRINNARKIVFISKSGYNSISKNKNKIYIPNPLEKPIKENIKNIKNIKNIIFVARNDPFKGVDFLKKILKDSNLFSKNTRVNIVGYQLKRQSKNINSLGQKTFEETSRIFAESDLFLSFSYLENTPNVLFEALENGNIPLVTDVGDCRRILKEDCFLFRPGDYNEFKIKLDKISKNPEDMGRKLEIRKKEINKEYSLKKSSLKIIKVLKNGKS